ncbi:MerR family transcriptional regulator [Streptococcus cuniculipharyngis]|nr:MerR family transcriptional regulator [Streptococcus cuniculipharyngis]
MTIKELAIKSGLAVSTIRYYERQGMIPQPERLSNNYRDYAPQMVNRLYLIQYLSGLGLSLAAIRDFLGKMAEQQLSKQELLMLIQAHQAKIKEQLASLLTIQERLNQLGEHDRLLDDFLAFDWASLSQEQGQRPVDDWIRTVLAGSLHQDIVELVCEQV